MWRVLLVVLALCSCALGKSIFDDDWVDPNPKKTDSPPPRNVAPPVQTPRKRPPVADPVQAPPVVPTPPAPTPAAEPEKGVNSELRVPPTDANLVEMQKSINEVYKDDLAQATTPDKKVALSRKLLEAGKNEGDELSRYALCAKARELALEGGEYSVAAASIEEMSRGFRVDTLRMSLDVIKGACKTVHTPQQKKELVDGAGDVVDKAIAAGHYEFADAAAELATTSARTSGSDTLIKSAADIAKRAKLASENYMAFQLASAILKNKPNDPDANLTAGRFLCFTKGNWESGLPMLALSKDSVLSAIANKDVTGATDSTARIAIADSWWDLAKSEKEQGSTKQIHVRAIKWYSEALPELSGLMKTRVEQRLNQLQGVKEAPTAVAATDGARPPEIVEAIARRDLVPGMTFREACKVARLPFKLISTSGNEKTYHWIIKGRMGTHQVAERGFRTVTYRTVADYGPIGYVEATFADDSLVSAQRVSTR